MFSNSAAWQLSGLFNPSPSFSFSFGGNTMKKLLITALLLGTTSAFAGTASTTVTVNGTVTSVCVFQGASTPATFDYDAVVGTTGAAPGGALLECNHLTVATMTSPASGAIVLNKTSPIPLGDTLNATFTVTPAGPAVGAGPNGGDAFTYSVSAGAAAGQWNASSGLYSNTVTVAVSF
jgi:hypothetical protein